MNTSQVAAAAALNAIGPLHNGGTLTLYSGTMPSTPETALSGNTALVAATYASPAFGSPSFGSGNETATASFSTSTYNPTNTAGATFARAVKSDGSTVIADYTVGSAWIASNAFAVGQYCTNGGNTYQCTTAGTSASSGGPSGTGSSITDGTVTWKYIGSGQQFDVLMGNCNVQVGTSVSFTQTLSMPAV